MKIFKTKIPTSQTQTITEVESFMLKWEIQDDGFTKVKVQYKAFVHKTEAEEFEKQLKAAAEFLGTWVKTQITRN